MGLNPQSLSRDGSGFLGSDTSSSTQILMKCVKTPLSSTFSCDLILFFVISFIHQRYPNLTILLSPKKASDAQMLQMFMNEKQLEISPGKKEE